MRENGVDRAFAGTIGVSLFGRNGSYGSATIIHVFGTTYSLLIHRSARSRLAGQYGHMDTSVTQLTKGESTLTPRRQTPFSK